MRKFILVTSFLFLLLNQSAFAAEEAPSVSAQSAIVYQADCGRILYEKQADRKMLIASTTKIMTAILAIETCDLTESVLITQEMADVEGSSMYLKAGESYSVQELLYGLLLASGNDAATALAVHTAGDERAFAALMNEKAAILGMKNTSFENPHGLDGEKHYSTAKDMAVLADYAMKNDIFAKIAGTRHISIKGLTYVNHNKLLWRCDGVKGVKTGYTLAAGRTLVTCCEREGQRLICVTLSARDDWNDHQALYDWAYGRYHNQVILEKDTQYTVPIVSGTDDTIRVEPLTDVSVFADEDDQVSYYVELPSFVFRPVRIGDYAGRIVVTVNGIQSAEVPIVCMENYNLEIKKPFQLNWLIRKLQGI